MGWLDWIGETAGKITAAIETGLRDVIGMPAEIEPYITERPATRQQIEEAMQESVYASRFIEEALPDEARRLARGVRFYEPLVNVARMRHWTVADPFAGPPPEGAYWSVRAVLIAPDGNMTSVDVRGKDGQALDRDEFLRAAASDLENDFVVQYEGVSRSDMIREWVVAMETYVERFKPLG